MTKHALPPAHKIGCYCPTCVLHEWDEHHAEMLEDISRAAEAATVAKANDALARANAPFNEGDWAEYCIYTAAVNNRAAGVPELQTFDCPDHPVDWRVFDVYGWLQSPMRQAQLDWQAQERTKLLELAREEGRQTGRQSSLEGGYSASSDLCGPSSTNKFEGTRYEALEDTGDLPSMADVEALFQETFVLPDNASLREIKRFERACEDAALKGYECSPNCGCRVSILPTGYDERKAIPVATGALDYFPLAIAAVAQLSLVANEQHSPGEPLHWAREKSTDEANTLLRHFMERGARDADGQRHSAKVAWRALALLQKEIEQDDGAL